MRKIITSDIFAMSRIIKKAKVSESLKEAFMKADGVEGEDGIKEIGIEAVLCVINGAGNEGVDELVYKFLNSVFETTNVEAMELEELFENLKELASKNNLTNFFKLASLQTPKQS